MGKQIPDPHTPEELAQVEQLLAQLRNWGSMSYRDRTLEGYLRSAKRRCEIIIMNETVRTKPL